MLLEINRKPEKEETLQPRPACRCHYRLRQGNVFTTVWQTSHPGQTPLLGRHPAGQKPRWADTLRQIPPGQTLPLTDTPLGRHPLPQADTPQANTPLGRHPPTDTPLGRHPPPPPPGDGHCSGRCASYWNAFS